MALVVEHHEELELDLLKQGVDLLDFWRGTLTARRLRVLVSNLPPGSTTVAKINPESVYLNAWTSTDFILANLYDAFTAANFKNPKPYNRPADAWQARVRAEQAAAFLEAQAERNRIRDREAGLRP